MARFPLVAGRWRVPVQVVVLIRQWMLCRKRSKPPSKPFDSYNTSLVLDMCRRGDIPPGLRHLLLTYPKAAQNSIDGHQNARKQVYCTSFVRDIAGKAERPIQRTRLLMLTPFLMYSLDCKRKSAEIVPH